MRILGVVSSSSREVPNAPTIGTATDVGTGRAFNNGAATVTFTAPTYDGGLPITGYTVTSSPGGFTGTGASSPVTVTGLQSNTAYTFTVRAANGVGQSLPSAASNSITATTVPQAPTIGTATAGNASATVAFTGNATGGKAVSTYTATSSPGSITGSSATSPITVSGLTNGTPYTFTVTATNANGTSTASAASNSVTPVAPALSYWSTFGGPMDQYFFTTAADSNARYYVGTVPQESGPVQGYIFASYSKLGAVNWQQKNVPVTTPFYVAPRGTTVDSSGNLIIAAWQYNSSASNQKFYVASVAPSTGTINWQYDYARSDATQSVSGVGRVVTDSSNNIYVGGVNITPILFKLNSSGTVQWAIRNFNITSAYDVVLPALTGTTNIYTLHRELFTSGKSGYNNGIVSKFSQSTGALSAQRRIGNDAVDNTGIFSPASICVDSSENVYPAGVRWTSTFYGCVFKLNSSLTITANSLFLVNISFVGSVCDSSGNIYLTGQNSQGIYVLKYNSSLVLQWQRLITNTGGGTASNPGIALDEANNKITINAVGNTYGWAFALPTDGSGTGSYTVGSVTINYAASSVGVSSAAIVNSTYLATTASPTMTRGGLSYSRTNTSRTVTTTTF